MESYENLYSEEAMQLLSSWHNGSDHIVNGGQDLFDLDPSLWEKGAETQSWNFPDNPFRASSTTIDQTFLPLNAETWNPPERSFPYQDDSFGGDDITIDPSFLALNSESSHGLDQTTPIDCLASLDELQNTSNLAFTLNDFSQQPPQTIPFDDSFNAVAFKSEAVFGSEFLIAPSMSSFDPVRISKLSDAEELVSTQAKQLLELPSEQLNPFISSFHTSTNKTQLAKGPNAVAQEDMNVQQDGRTIPGCSTIDLGTTCGRKRKRSKFNDEARKKVAAVREKGACFRCRITKTSVGFRPIETQELLIC